ncbi:hypothetical protein [Legionella cardiaca]|uniref:Thioredoxin domain-containing protein n=1 Tax=Legionella cardiaca TaxID=1071983 RepID=A0ABY8AQ70_9GAMM|nr:hypothetical protein [Legionella cardiaca]WED41934.1 hypothetical protein PXX05_08290 [Legionella cardiaca]
MRFVARIVLCGLLYAIVSLSWADASSSWFTHGENKEIKIQVSLFLSSTCTHCQKADAFFRGLEANTPWLEVHRYLVNLDKTALTTFNQFLEQQGSDDFSVPAIFFCNSHWIGFAEANSSGKELLRGLNYCHDKLTQTGQLDANTTKVLRQWASANLYGSNITSPPSAAVFLPMVALTDSLNPCSIFGIVTLFSFLWLSRNRTLQLTLGLSFLVVVGIVHYIQQVHTAFFFQAYSGLRIPVILIGLGLLAYVLGYLKAFNEKQAIIVPCLVALTALAIQAYMQTCTPNFSLIFEQWLSAQGFSPAKTVILEILYQLFYLLPWLLFILVIVFWGKAARFAKYQNILAKMAYIFLVIVVLVFIFYPYALAKFWLSFLALPVTFFIAFILRKRAFPLP